MLQFEQHISKIEPLKIYITILKTIYVDLSVYQYLIHTFCPVHFNNFHNRKVIFRKTGSIWATLPYHLDAN